MKPLRAFSILSLACVVVACSTEPSAEAYRQAALEKKVVNIAASSDEAAARAASVLLKMNGIVCDSNRAMFYEIWVGESQSSRAVKLLLQNQKKQPILNKLWINPKVS